MKAQLLPSLFILGILIGCSADTPPQTASPALDLADVLGGDNTGGDLRAEALRTFSFPQDHGPHPGFRNEWWYLTGNLETEQGRRFGYQVTFFSTAVAGAGEPAAASTDAAVGPVAASAWHSERIWMAHVALTDVEGGEHYPLERFSRENPGLAGATLAPFRVWLEGWQLRTNGDGFPWQLDIEDTQLDMHLSLQALKPPVLQGDKGLSQKSPEPGNASYYYSLPRVDTLGTLRIGTETFTVNGLSWLDREWSTSALAPDQSGWDWFSLQFDEGNELMYYQLRTDRGAVHPNSQGNWTDANAQQTLLAPDQIELEELESWTSPGGIVYTTAWRMRYADKEWRIEAVLADQWMNLSIPYWEGAVDVLNIDGTRAGRGYLEMVRE